MISKDIDGFFSQFDEVYENRTQYNMEWAFKDAQGKIDLFQEDVIETKIKRKCLLSDGINGLNLRFHEFQDKTQSAIRRQKWLSKIFANTYSIITLLEFLISVMFVLLISEISHSGGEMVTSPMFSMWVVIIFAFFKVFIEQFYIRPKMEVIGWRLYRKSVLKLKDLTQTFNEQLT